MVHDDIRFGRRWNRNQRRRQLICTYRRLTRETGCVQFSCFLALDPMWLPTLQTSLHAIPRPAPKPGSSTLSALTHTECALSIAHCGPPANSCDSNPEKHDILVKSVEEKAESATNKPPRWEWLPQADLHAAQIASSGFASTIDSLQWVCWHHRSLHADARFLVENNLGTRIIHRHP